MPADLPLHPDVRSLYGGSLRPPPGTVFDAGVATTFTLDIETALAVPVTLALFASEDRDELLKSPLALIEGLERTADRLAIFCEAGRIQAQPAPQSRLCTLLERLIIEVSAPRGGSFHPKLWVLRYVPLETDEPVRIRLLVLSRNLTRDRSWDLCLSLDGKVGRRRSATNAPLVDLLRRLPSLATGAAPEHVDPLVDDLSKDLHRTHWTLPAPFEKVEFAVNGTKRRVWRPPGCRSLGVVSPFCDEDTLEMLADQSIEPSVLVSRSDELIKVNFISLTPGTTFNLRSSTGISRERALLFHLLKEMVERRQGLCNLLQVGAGVDSWRRIIEQVRGDFGKVDRKLIDDFRAECTDRNLIDGLAELCRLFQRWRSHYPQEMTGPRNRAIAELRSRLAHVCVDALEPDLIILDEFQRFTELLHGDHDAALLARELFDYTDREGNAARTLLLSATPYRMLTLSGDTEDDGVHYRELLETLRFLFGHERGPKLAEALSREVDRFRRAMLSLPHSKDTAREHKRSIEERLRAVIARTERVASTRDRDSMVEEPKLTVGVEPGDLRSAAAVAEVARVADAPEVVEYWKSAPYLLNFMRDYALKREIRAYDGKECPAPLLDAIKATRRSSLTRRHVRKYRPLKPPNGRMRLLMDDVFGGGLDQHLWIPPSLPYYRHSDTDERPTSKSLVFSSWSVVPDAVAAVLSYEAERRMGVKQAGMRYFDRQRPRPLQFRIAQGRLAGLRALLLVYPSPLIAQAADPLDVVACHSETLSYDAMRAALAARLKPYVRRLQSAADESTDLDTWQWAGPAVLDALAGNRSRIWLEDADDGFACLGAEDAWGDHVDALRKAVRARRIGGTVPDAALELLVDLALGSPAVCALRALRRIAPTLEWDDPALLTAASRIAWGFRTLYNQHDTVALLRRESDNRYWHSAITHGARNNLQAVLDEYVHCLVESEGLTDKAPHLRVTELAGAVSRAISLLPSQIEIDEPRVRAGRLRIRKSTMRGRFAMRLADYRDEEGSAARLSGVRDAFNSPFRPFVLATTSIGQEGLDFHPYCHRLHHWNLPRNPVDMEQREGRVHRYKGHAIRLNVAANHGAAVRGCGAAPNDPWAAMFAAARAASPTDSDLIPYWICDGPVKVERRVPLLPYSREIARLKWLKKSVAVYRLAFGQPRQDDLLAYLSGLDETLSTDEMDALQIRLDPPAS